MECSQKINIKKCICTSTTCSRKGFCCLCIEHHREKNQLPACYFSVEAEKTHDRSIKNFLKDKK